MAIKTYKKNLTKDWQLLLDNTINSSADASFFVNHGSGEFLFSISEPNSTEIGMEISAEPKFLYVPVGTKLWGRLNSFLKDFPDNCSVFVNVNE